MKYPAVERQVAHHFVGRHVVESETFPSFVLQLAPILKRRAEQPERAHHIRLEEDRRLVDGPVDVAFRSQVHDLRHSFAAEQVEDALLIADIDAMKLVVWAALDIGQRGEVPGIGQLVEVDDAVLAGRNQMPAHGASDEPRAAGNEDRLSGVTHRQVR